MSDFAYLSLSKDHAVEAGSPGNTVTIKNLTGDTVYYGDRQVSAGQNYGNLTPGQSVAIANGQVWWFLSFGYSTVLMQTTAVAGSPNVGANSIPVTTVASASGSQILNVLTAGQAFAVTLTGNWTPTFSGAVAGTECVIDMQITSDVSGGHVITWPATVVWAGGFPPPVASPSQTQFVTLISFDGGSTYLGSASISSFPVSTIPAASGSQALTVLPSGGGFLVTLSGNWSPTFSGAVANTECVIDLSIVSDGAGGHVITWPGVIWKNGAAPPTAIIAAPPQLVRVVSLNGGTTWLANAHGYLDGGASI